MLHTVVTVTSAVAEAATEQAEGIPPVLLGGLAFGGLVFALAVTYAFRNVGSRH